MRAFVIGGAPTAPGLRELCEALRLALARELDLDQGEQAATRDGLLCARIRCLDERRDRLETWRGRGGLIERMLRQEVALAEMRLASLRARLDPGTSQDPGVAG